MYFIRVMRPNSMNIDPSKSRDPNATGESLYLLLNPANITRVKEYRVGSLISFDRYGSDSFNVEVKESVAQVDEALRAATSRDPNTPRLTLHVVP